MIFVVLVPLSAVVAYVAIYIAAVIVLAPFILLGRAIGRLCQSAPHASSATQPQERLEPTLRAYTRPPLYHPLYGRPVPLSSIEVSRRTAALRASLQVTHEPPKRLTHDG